MKSFIKCFKDKKIINSTKTTYLLGKREWIMKIVYESNTGHTENYANMLQKN